VDTTLSPFAHEQKSKVWRYDFETFLQHKLKVKCGYDFESFRTQHKSKEWPRPYFYGGSSAKKTNVTLLLQEINIPKNTCDFASVRSRKVNYLEIRLWDLSPDVLKSKLEIQIRVLSSNRDTTLSPFSIK